MNDATRIHPIERLVGKTLPGGWKVVERRSRDPGGSGMSRSVCYVARNDRGESAFLKVSDFRELERQGSLEELAKMTREHLHERDIHSLCSKDGLNRVTRYYDSGTMVVDDVAMHYLLTECADGTIRELHPPGEKNVPLSARLRFHREIASALNQLHRANIAHQDLKPSNAVHLGGQRAKLTDMGSASSPRLESPPHDLARYAGQPNYAPYELLYGQEGSFYVRRIGCDIYLLGNLIFTDIVGVSLTALVLHGLDRTLRHDQFTGPYADVMPDIVDIHESVFPDVLADSVPANMVTELSALISNLCHPDPRRRGHQRNIVNTSDQYGLERVISALDRLSTKAALGR